MKLLARVRGATNIDATVGCIFAVEADPVTSSPLNTKDACRNLIFSLGACCMTAVAHVRTSNSGSLTSGSGIWARLLLNDSNLDANSESFDVALSSMEDRIGVSCLVVVTITFDELPAYGVLLVTCEANWELLN
jgi:hypothetical protein